MRIAWGTDIHLDHAGEDQALAFCRAVQAHGAQALLLGGDIANAQALIHWLAFIDTHVPVPVFFVLGNHDYYGSSIARVRQAAIACETDTLRFLPTAGLVALDERTALVGHGGWGDAELGDFFGSPVVLTDYVLIAELRDAGVPPGTRSTKSYGGFEDKPALKKILRELGRASAEHLRPALTEALERFETVIVLTHVPPFRDACWHAGEISNDHWLPGFTCKAMGDLLIEQAARHPHRKVTVLCGHTHSSGKTQPLPNLQVITGGAKYGTPVARTLELGDRAAE